VTFLTPPHGDTFIPESISSPIDQEYGRRHLGLVILHFGPPMMSLLLGFLFPASGVMISRNLSEINAILLENAYSR